MKLARFLYPSICFLVLTFSVTAFAQNHTGYATVVRLTGEGRYSADGGATWHPLLLGQTLGPGSVIQSASDSGVDLVLGEKIARHIVPSPDQVAPAADAEVRGLASYHASAQQNVIHLESDSVLSIDKLTIGTTGVDAVSDTELDLRQGTIFGNVKKLSATSQYLIKMPNGIAGVRGTTFILSANGDITVISGSMVVSHTGRNGQVSTEVLGPGDRLDPRTGQIIHLTEAEMKQAERRAVFTITVAEGIIRLVGDHTILYISPTTGTRE